MLLAPFLWIFCEFDEKVLDNLSLAKLPKVFLFPVVRGWHHLISQNFVRSCLMMKWNWIRLGTGKQPCF